MLRDSAAYPVAASFGPHRMRRVFLGIALAALLSMLTVFGAGDVLSRAAHHSVGLPPPDLRAEPVRIALLSSEFISGWFVSALPRRGALLLLHGVRSDRLQMIGRARLLRAAGYSVLLIDFPGHGESSCERITFGARESQGVTASLEYLRRRLPQDRIGVVAVSLGAAA